jgi:hypothetical protein
MKRWSLWFVVSPILLVLLAFWVGVGAQTQSSDGKAKAPSTQFSSALANTSAQTKNPGVWNYPDNIDAVVAAANIHHVRYEDDHVRFEEVAYFPGVKGAMHGHPWPSVFARDAPAPPMAHNATLDLNSPQNGQDQSEGKAPNGRDWPTCSTMGPQAPHAVTNNDTFPLHFYRVEFKRVDGDGIKSNWKTWYPWLLVPVKPVQNLLPGPELGPPFSNDFPYPIAYDSYIAAPNNHTLRYEDSHVRFLEVAFRPGERENLHGHPYPSVFANDAAGTTGGGVDFKLEPFSTMNGQDGNQGAPPKDLQYPRCSTMGPQAPHAAQNLGPYPAHFYRIEFKRIDGDGLKTHWREWYPWMAQLADEYQQTKNQQQ